jgi:2-iminobutanoate/2-iminopropanoate deaminase
MMHVRTEKAPVPVGPYSQAIINDKLVFCSGQLGIDPLTGKLVASGTADEARQCLKNISSVLEAAGSSMSKAFKDINAIYADSFKEPFPARTTIGVARLPLGATIEIEVIASV